MAKEFFRQKWSKPIPDYRIIKTLCKINKKIFKELPIFDCEDDYTKAMDYFVIALTAYKAGAEVIFNRLVNVTIVCQIFKPMLTLQTYKISIGAIKQFLRC